MIVEEILPRLTGVRRNLRGYAAYCPAHKDRSPSLSIREGENGILLHCFAGCRLQDLCKAIGIAVRDLFYATKKDTRTVREAIARRREEQRRQAKATVVNMLTIDALREADYFIRSRQGFEISAWNDYRLNEELNALADAYYLIKCEAMNG